MAKPRTNDGAAQWWADSILEREPRPRTEVNSILITNDVIYSFGYHYPMGVIVRRPDGRAKRVVLNSDHYPSRGFANTPGDQSSVRIWAKDAVSRASWEIELQSLPLSAYANDGLIQVRPRPNDPEPDPYPRCEVPPYFFATDPGPEPVKSAEGCVAGERVVRGVVEEIFLRARYLTGREHFVPEYTFRRKFFPNRARSVVAYIDHATRELQSVLGPRVQRAGVEIELYGEKSWMHPRPRNVRYKQCPHCAEFERRHQEWHARMYGGYGHRNPGYARYCELMDRFGSEDAWREARLQDLRRVREARARRKAWAERNFIPLDAVPTDRQGIPRLDANGYPFRKHEEEHRRAQRRRERAERRAQREHEARMREREQIERFKARVKRQRGDRFEVIASNVAATLAQIAGDLSQPTNSELESSDVAHA